MLRCSSSTAIAIGEMLADGNGGASRMSTMTAVGFGTVFARKCGAAQKRETEKRQVSP